MSDKYLNQTGLRYFWNKIKSVFLPLSGGELTGKLHFKDSNSISSRATTSYFLTMRSFANGGDVEYITADNLYTQLRANLGTPYNSYFGTCSSDTEAQTKVVTTTTGNFALVNGAKVAVLFTYAQTYNGVPALNVDGTGAVSTYYRASYEGRKYEWQAGEIVEFYYYDGKFVIADGGIASTAFWGITKLSSSVTSTSTSYAATPSAVKTAYDYAGQAHAILTGLIKTTTYSVNNVQVPSNSTYDPSASEMGFNTPSGYIPIGYRKISISDDELTFSYIDINATQYSTALRIHNPTESTKIVSIEMTIVYIKSDVESQA